MFEKQFLQKKNKKIYTLLPIINVSENKWNKIKIKEELKAERKIVKDKLVQNLKHKRLYILVYKTLFMLG